MGSHFKQGPSGAHGGQGSAHGSSDVPELRFANASPEVGFVPIMSEPSGKRHRHNRRTKSAHYRETDPYDLSGRRSRDPRKRVGRVVSVLLFIVGIGLIAGAAGLWVYNQWQYRQQDQINEKLAEYATVYETAEKGTPSVDWAGLKAVNSEVVGWVQIPGTVVNFPVYQAQDNNKYLHTNAEGEYSVGGQVFLDASNTAPGMVDQQSIIYGHHLRNGAMFKPIADMSKQEMFDAVGTVWYLTEDSTYELEPLLIYHTDADDQNVRRFSFDSTEALQSYLTELVPKSLASRSDAADVIARTSQVMTLCTCDYTEGDSGRTVLICVPKADQAAEQGAQ